MIRLSVTAVQDFLRCPFVHYLKRIKRIVPEVEPDPLRQGNIYHEAMELLRGNRHRSEDEIMDILISYLDRQYAQVPQHKTFAEWNAERVTAFWSIVAFFFQYEAELDDSISTESWFEIPVADDCVFVAKIDNILKTTDCHGQTYYCIEDFKTTSADIEAGGKFWQYKKNDLQAIAYVWMLQHLQLNGELARFGITENDPLIMYFRYNVVRKPTIKPKCLTTKETAEFIDSGGMYLEAQFELEQDEHETYSVNGIEASSEFTKTGTLKLRETADMYGVRLRNDMLERPNFYFNQKTIEIPQKQLDWFGNLLYTVYRNMKFKTENDTFEQNFDRCGAFGGCEYIPICHSFMDVEHDELPSGLMRK